MHGRIAATLLLLCAIPAAAQRGPGGYIIRCTKGDQVSVQNVPCDPGWKQQGEADVYYAPNDSARAKQERARIQREMDERNAAMKRPAWSTGTGRVMDEKDCLNARAYRDRVRTEIGSQRLTRRKEVELCRLEEQACGSCRW